jgi:hypothetical protein
LNSLGNNIQLTLSSGVMLKCGLHKCTSSCHQLVDHSKISCKVVLTKKCSIGHTQSWQCYVGASAACRKCEDDKKKAAKKAQKDLEEKLKREEKIQKHLKEMAIIEEEIAQTTLSMENSRLESEQQAVLAQKRKDLKAIKDRSLQTQSSPQGDPLGIYDDDDPKSRTKTLKKPPQISPKPVKTAPHQNSNLQHIKATFKHNKSPSKTEWQRQKDQENASNPAIDKIMEMIGLEEVKRQVLRIKAKVETSIRQGTDIKKERLGLVLLGNPGTGMSFSLSPREYDSNHLQAKLQLQGTTRVS